MEGGKTALSELKTMEKTDHLREFRVSFFAMSRLASFPWTMLDEDLQGNKSSELVSELLKQTCLHPLCQKFPPSVRYRRLFLSELIKRHEATAGDPLDELYDALAEVVGAAEAGEGYKSYFMPGGDAVSLLENTALISQGTTGLVTWEAALYLAEWALDHRQLFTGRSVLELGSGVGLAGITICRACGPRSFVFSDCHAAVLQKLRENVRLNGLSRRTSPAVAVEELDWTTVTDDRLAEIGADTVIATDVVYDPDITGSLVTLLSRILKPSSAEVRPEVRPEIRPEIPPEVRPEVLICSAVRNPETYDTFKQQLENAGISHRVMSRPVSAVFPYNRLASIELMKLYR